MADSTLRHQDHPVGFSFSVKIDSHGISDECNFQEISGLKVTMDTEELKEGEENTFSHGMPSRPKYQNLVLKRGIASAGLLQWAQTNISNFSFAPVAATIMLLDEKKDALAVWNVANAYPVGIKMADFKTGNGEIAIEMLEVAFDYLERIK